MPPDAKESGPPARKSRHQTSPDLSVAEQGALSGYAAAARRYLAAGWGSPLPLPPRRKKPPPEGFTGYDGAVASAADVEAWCEEQPAANICMRVNPGVIGIDVDAYKGAPELAAWQELVGKYGELPPAPWCTSRDDGISGIRLFTVPDGYAAITEMGLAGEVIQHQHRYIVVPPSVSPDPPAGTSKPYRWEGSPDGFIPALRFIPPLPQAWLDGLRAGAPRPGAGFQQPGGRTTSWTEPDLEALIASGIPGGGNQDNYLRDLVWKLVTAGLNETGVRAVWDTVAARTPLLRPGQPWTDGDFRRHYQGAARKLAAGQPDEQGDSDPLRIAVEQRMHLLRIDARAREQLAAEGTPAIPPVWPGDQFLSQPDESPRWRITGLWPAGGNVVLAAQYKAGKTTMRDNLIRSWCDGGPFLGAYDVEPPGAPLLVIDAELPPSTARRWIKDHRISRAAGFRYINIRGAASSMNILTGAGRRQWAELAAGAGAVLLDCLGPVMGALGLDENSGADIGRFLASFEEMLAGAGVPESFVVHHMGHAAERSRGASRLRDWPDAEWRLVRQDEDPASPRYFSAFGRDVDIPESRLEYDAGSRGLTIGGGSRKEASATAGRKAIIRLLTASPDLSGNQIVLALERELGRNNVRTAIGEAIKAGDITTKPGPRNATLHALSSPVRRSAPWRTGEVIASSSPPLIGGELARSPDQHEPDKETGELTDPPYQPATGSCVGCFRPCKRYGEGGSPYCDDCQAQRATLAEASQ